MPGYAYASTNSNNPSHVLLSYGGMSLHPPSRRASINSPLMLRSPAFARQHGGRAPLIATCLPLRDPSHTSANPPLATAYLPRRTTPLPVKSKSGCSSFTMWVYTPWSVFNPLGVIFSRLNTATDRSVG